MFCRTIIQCVVQIETYLRSTLGNNVSVSSQLLTSKWKDICQLCSQQWHGSYHWYPRPSKWQRQLFLLTFFMSSYDRFICKNTFTSYVGFFASYDPRCFFTVSQKFSNLREFFRQIVYPPPPGKKLPVRLWWWWWWWWWLLLLLLLFISIIIIIIIYKKI